MNFILQRLIDKQVLQLNILISLVGTDCIYGVKHSQLLKIESGKVGIC